MAGFNSAGYKLTRVILVTRKKVKLKVTLTPSSEYVPYQTLEQRKNSSTTFGRISIYSYSMRKKNLNLFQ
jgi:hypothetical protein